MMDRILEQQKSRFRSTKTRNGSIINGREVRGCGGNGLSERTGGEQLSINATSEDQKEILFSHLQLINPTDRLSCHCVSSSRDLDLPSHPHHRYTEFFFKKKSFLERERDCLHSDVASNLIINHQSIIPQALSKARVLISLVIANLCSQLWACCSKDVFFRMQTRIVV